MARINFNDIETRIEEKKNFASGNFKRINGFFLKDKESSYVKVLLDDIKDVEVHSVHLVKIKTRTGKDFTIHVDCLGNNCPLCEEAKNHTEEMYPVVSKARDMVYVPLLTFVNYKGEEEIGFSVLGRSTSWAQSDFFPDMARYGITENFEIQRTGSGTGTTYRFYPARQLPSGKPFPDVDMKQVYADLNIELPADIYGRSDSYVRSWDVEQMEEYIETGAFPKTKANENEVADEVTPRTTNHGF